MLRAPAMSSDELCTCSVATVRKLDLTRREMRSPIHEGDLLRRSTALGSATANVQAFVELLIQLLLLGIVYRLLLLFSLFSFRVGRKLLSMGLQMTDRRFRHSGRGICERFGIADSIAQNQGAAEDGCGEKS